MHARVVVRETRSLGSNSYEKAPGAPCRLTLKSGADPNEQREANLLIQVKAPSDRVGHYPLEGLHVFVVLATANASHPRRVQC
jgi:hypothetical protein